MTGFMAIIIIGLVAFFVLSYLREDNQAAAVVDGFFKTIVE